MVELDAASDDALGNYLDQLNAGEGPLKWHIRKLAARTGEAGANGAGRDASSNVAEGHSVFIARTL